MGNCYKDNSAISKIQRFKIQLRESFSAKLLQKFLVLYNQCFIEHQQTSAFLNSILKPQEIRQMHKHFKEAIQMSFEKRQKQYNQKKNQQKNKILEVERQFQNWGENQKYKIQPIFYPKSFQEIQIFIKNLQSGSSVRAVGFRHSWSQIFSDPNQYMISILSKSYSTGTSSDVIQKVQDIIFKRLYEQKDGFYYIGYHPDDDQGNKQRRLVRIGAGVTNQQCRKWSRLNFFCYPFNVIMVQITVVGAVATCSHGSGIKNRALCDIVYEIQFINCNGEIQKINKKDHPELIKSASSAIGLLGIITHVTLEMEPLKHVNIQPKIRDIQVQIPRIGLGSEQQVDQFQKKCMMDYSEWFYFTKVNKSAKKVVYSNCWNKGEPIKLKCFQQLPEFPPFLLAAFQIYGTEAFRFIQNRWRGLFLILFSKFVFIGLPTQNKIYKACTIDAIHFQRGVQNVSCRDFQVQINIPFSKKKGAHLFDIVRTAFWIGVDTVQLFTDNSIDIALELRIFNGSECTLAPQNGYDATCSIEILRTPPQNKEQQKNWGDVIEYIFNKWKSITYTDDNDNVQPVQIRPHWGKQWSKYQVIWNHLQKDQKLQSNIKKFQSDYKQIAKIGKWNPEAGKKMFSTATFNRLIFDR